MSNASRRVVCVLVGTITAAAARPAAAQGWSQLPNGEWGFNTDLATTGVFGCGPAAFLPAGASCAASANSITIGNAGSFLTMTFAGTTQTITATNVRQPVGSLGTITKSFSGSGPFTFPLTTNPNVVLLTFRLNLTTATSVGGTTFGYLGTSPSTLVYNCCDAFARDFVALGTAPLPPGARSSTVMVFNNFAAPVFTTGPGSVALGGQVGLVPEPGTVALTAAGLAAVALGAARRRRA